jgi:hypothetical protein
VSPCSDQRVSAVMMNVFEMEIVRKSSGWAECGVDQWNTLSIVL